MCQAMTVKLETALGFYQGQIIIEGKKFCPKCRTAKPVEEFGNLSIRSTGMSTFCRDCVKKEKYGDDAS